MGKILITVLSCGCKNFDEYCFLYLRFPVQLKIKIMSHNMIPEILIFIAFFRKRRRKDFFFYWAACCIILVAYLYGTGITQPEIYILLRVSNNLHDVANDKGWYILLLCWSSAVLCVWKNPDRLKSPWMSRAQLLIIAVCGWSHADCIESRIIAPALKGLSHQFESG